MTITFTAVTGASNPFNGVDVGYNSAPRFVDIDRDGDLDVFIGNNDGDVKYYRNVGTSLAPVYVVQTGADNPLNGENIGNLATPVFGDLDGDGDHDVLIGEYDGVINYYKNTGTVRAPLFAVQTGSDNPLNGVDVGTRSSPVFADIDGDGDLDVFIGRYSNGEIRYYKNTGSATNPIFSEQTGADNPLDGVSVFQSALPIFVDIDGDADLDVFIGQKYGELTYYKNTGTVLVPAYALQTGALNPFNGVDVGYNSRPEFGDIDGDGDKDLLIGDSYGTISYYRNDSTAAPTPAYIERTGASNPFNGVDVGSYAYLSFADINGDGDIDAFATNGVANDVRYFLNSGNKIAATFAEQTGASNPFNGTRVIDNQAPYTSTVHSLAIADINGDGDQDIIFVGSPRGNSSPYPVLYQTWNNTGSALTPAFSSGGTSSTGNINTTGRISLVDIDADGDQDMFVDRPAVNAVAFFENTGTAISPSFVNVTGAANPLNSLTSPFSYQVAFVDIDKDGDQDFFVNSNGTIAFYRNTGNATTAAFLNVTGSSNPFNGQTLSSGNLHFTDIDGDADDDLFISRSDGTIRYYENTAVAVPANAAPTLTGLVASVTYAENTVNATAQVVDSDVTFADADSADLNGGNLTITYSVGGGTEDQLAIRNEGTGAGQIGISAGTVTYGGVTIGTVPTSGAGSGINGATLVVTFTAAAATPTAVDALIQNITYLNNSNSPTAARTISITVNDGDGGTSTAATTVINVTAQNDAPVVAAFDATPSFTEGGSATVLDNNLTLSDADSTNLTGATISISANFVSGDRLNFTDQNGITGSYNSGTGVLTLTGTTTVANYQTALRTITFDSTSDNPTAAARTISLVVTDGTDSSNTPTITQSVTPVNDAPLVAGFDATPSYTEGGSATVLDNNLTLSDADSSNLTGATISISANFVSGDRLNFTDQNGITGSYNSGTGVLTLSGTTTVANYQTALRTITFDSTSDNPTAAARTISLVVTDGTDSSNTPTITQSVTPVNDAPLVAGFDATPSYTEGGSATVLDNNLTLSDADSTNLTGATISISANFVSGDRLNFTDQNGITGSYNSGTGVLTLSGTTTVANYQTALRTITFDSTSDNPTAAARTISLVVTDGTDSSNTPTITQSVTPVNDAPLVAGFDATPSYTEGGSATVLDNNLTLSDADSTNLTGATISISANFVSGDRLNFTDQNGITGSYNSGTGVLTLSGTTTVANYQTALRTITFDSTSDNPTAAARTISLVVTDGTDNSNTPTITQSVTPVNDAPINVVPGAQTVTAGQNLVITGISTTDADHSSMATYVLSVDIGTLTLSTAVGGGVNAGQVGGNGTATVTITGATLAAINATLADAAGLTYTHSAAGAATLTITATDASAGSDADTVAITINAAPGGGSGGAVGSPAPSNPGDVITTPDDSGNLFGGAGDDTITMLDENNTQGVYVQAGAGADNITLGNRGDNTVAGGQGNDTIYGSVGRDHLNGNRGNDNIFGSNSADVLFGGKEDDFINGNGGNDTISGDLGHDGLRGGAGDDTITGGAGNDILWGDRGNDRLTGGSEIDTFAFTGNTGNDIITDFNAAEGDRLSLSGQAYTATTSGDNTVLTLADGSTITLTGVANFDSAWVQ